MSRTVRVIAFILSLLCLAVIVYLSLAKNVSVPEYVLGKDKGNRQMKPFVPISSAVRL